MNHQIFGPYRAPAIVEHDDARGSWSLQGGESVDDERLAADPGACLEVAWLAGRCNGQDEIERLRAALNEAAERLREIADAARAGHVSANGRPSSPLWTLDRIEAIARDAGMAADRVAGGSDK